MARQRLPKVCGKPGCWEDLPCPAHTPKAWANVEERRSSEDRKGRAKRNRQILTRDGHTCQACHGTRCGNQDLQVDHIIPISQGGSDSASNLQTLGSRPCHTEKTQAETKAAIQRARGLAPLDPFD